MTRMHIEVRGTGPDVVLLHGIPGSGAVWDQVAARLERDHRVLIPDLIGFGRSTRTRAIDELWTQAQAAALGEALDAAGAEDLLVAGHDYGVPVALTLWGVRRTQISGLVLAAGNAFTDTPIPLPIRAVTWPLVGGLAKAALFSGPSLAMMLRQGATVALDRTRYLGDGDQQAAIRTIFATALRELRARYAQVEALLPTITVPTLVVWGERDPFFPVAEAERLAAAIPGAELRVFEGCGHFIPEERPEELAAALAACVRAASHA